MTIFRCIDSGCSIKNLELGGWNTIGMNPPSILHGTYFNRAPSSTSAMKLKLKRGAIAKTLGSSCIRKFYNIPRVFGIMVAMTSFPKMMLFLSSLMWRCSILLVLQHYFRHQVIRLGGTMHGLIGLRSIVGYESQCHLFTFCYIFLSWNYHISTSDIKEISYAHVHIGANFMGSIPKVSS